jgi:hypothetical protein
MKLHGSFLGQGRPLKTKPWLRLASQASLSRGLKRGGQQFQGFRDDVSTHSWQQTSQLQASYMWFSPTYHASYIIYHIYIYTVYFHIVSYIIYIAFIHPQTKSKTTTGPSRSRRRSCNWSRCSDRCGGERIPHSLGREMEYMIYSIKIYVISRDVVHHRLCMIYIYICTYMQLISLTLFYLTYLL